MPVLEATVVLVDGAVIKLLVSIIGGTAVGLLPDLFPQIRFERVCSGLGGRRALNIQTAEK